MSKKYAIAVVAGLVLGMQVMSFATQDGIPIDAITQSTLKLLNTSRAYATKATLNFSYTESNGSRPLVYGTSTSYGTSGGDIAGGKKTDTLKNLQPNTKYYFKVDGVYSGRTRYTMTGSFSTPTSVGINVSENFVKQTNSSLVSIGSNSFSLPFINDKSVNVELYSLTGKLVVRYTADVQVNVATVPAIMINNRGTYICKITGKNTLIKQTIVLSK